MFKRMTLLALCFVLPSCHDSGRQSADGPELRLRKVETQVVEIPKSRPAESASRTGDFARSAARLPRHPAIGPHSPEQIRQRVAALDTTPARVEPPLVEPPRQARAPQAAERAAPPPSRAAKAPKRAAAVPPKDDDEEIIEVVDEEEDVERPAKKKGERMATLVVPMVVERDQDGKPRRRMNDADDDGRSVDDRGSGHAGNSHCHQKALGSLQRLSPAGYAVYQRINDKKSFTTWLLCDDMQRGLTTAVHETVHMLTDQLDAYPLIDGGKIARLKITDRMAKPGRIAGQFNKSDDFVRTYLMPGGASSADYFTYLLDEFNAYTHDLHTAIQTVSMAPKDSNLGHRDGMAAMMSFMMSYVRMAEGEEPETWRALQRPDVSKVVSTLWSEAERTIERSCKVPRYSVDDQSYLNHICDPANGRALGRIIGRAPRCPKACLSASG